MEKGKNMTEKNLTIYFQAIKYKPRTLRAETAVRYIKKMVKKHCKNSVQTILVAEEVNKYMWSRGSQHIPSKVELTIIENEKEKKAKAFLKSGTQLAQEKALEKTKKEADEKKKKEKEAKKTEVKEKTAEEKEKEKALEEKKLKEKMTDAMEHQRK